MGGPKGRKIEILDGFLNMLFEPIILVKIYLIFNKIDGEKHMDFVLFLVVLFVFFCTLETSKIVLPSRRELNFYKIAFFAFDEKRQRNQIRKGLDFDVNLGLDACEISYEKSMDFKVKN